MRICYVAKHDQRRSNDDEGAICHALEALGHEVVRISEHDRLNYGRLTGDLLLFHGWHDFESIRRTRMPRAFWYFDLVDFPDPTLRARCDARVEWVRRVTELCDVGFLTDGDWVAGDRSGKLHWLPQGTDERKIYRGRPLAVAPVVFTGISRGGGVQRESFVAEMERVWGPKFCHVPKGAYGRDLADLAAGTRVVVAPDSPVTPRYWSNRAYLAAGHGAVLLHPACGLEEHYRDGVEVAFYHSRTELHEMIEYYLSHPGERAAMSAAAMARTTTKHTYRHRCEQLVRAVEGLR